MDEYIKIVKEVKIKIPENSQCIDIAMSILFWFGQNENWLLIIDNLDDINVIFINNLDLQNIIIILLSMKLNSRRQTLIIIRNPNIDNISIQILKILLFDKSELIDIFSFLFNISVLLKSVESEYAEKIVKELDYLSLIIMQIAVYIKIVQSDTFSKFLKHYVDHRSWMNKWFPLESRSYSYTVTITWQMSFNTVYNANPITTKFFQLLTFFNSNDSLIEFLRMNTLIMNEDLQILLSDEFELPQVLLRLETFSLLK